MTLHPAHEILRKLGIRFVVGKGEFPSNCPQCGNQTSNWVELHDDAVCCHCQKCDFAKIVPLPAFARPAAAAAAADGKALGAAESAAKPQAGDDDRAFREARAVLTDDDEAPAAPGDGGNSGGVPSPPPPDEPADDGVPHDDETSQASGQQAGQQHKGDEGDIPADTMDVIRDGVEDAQRSIAFWNVMLVLKRRGFSVDRIITLLEKYPDGIAKKYRGRLRDEVERDYRKIKDERGEPTPTTIAITSKTDFLANFIPPDYLVEGILQRRFAYSLTAITGHGKTALALLLARTIGCADEAACFGSHAAEKGRIIYFVGENPDDVRCRIIGDDSTRTDDPGRDNIHFIVGVFDIEELRAQLVSKIDQVGGADLVIIDTSAAYFLQEDENSNPQMHEHANRLRSLTTLPGAPCVVALCHPIKNANDPSQLVPRGGGSFLAAMDGNLTLWKHDDDLVTLHHSPDKWRGPGFEPITFKLEKISTEKLVDSKGRQIPTVHAVAISDAEEKEQEANAERDEDQLLAVLGSGNRRRSMTELAEACGWFVGNGEPSKSRVQRVLRRLLDAKLVKRVRGKYKLTKEGIEEAGLDADEDTVIDDRGGAISKEPFHALRGAKQRPTIPCAYCGEVGDDLMGGVYRCADGRQPKGQRHHADLHEGCAEPYFSGRPKRGRGAGAEGLF